MKKAKQFKESVMIAISSPKAGVKLVVRVCEIGDYLASYVFYDKCEHVLISSPRRPCQIEMSSI